MKNVKIMACTLLLLMAAVLLPKPAFAGTKTVFKKKIVSQWSADNRSGKYTQTSNNNKLDWNGDGKNDSLAVTGHYDGYFLTGVTVKINGKKMLYLKEDGPVGFHCDYIQFGKDKTFLHIRTIGEEIEVYHDRLYLYQRKTKTLKYAGSLDAVDFDEPGFGIKVSYGMITVPVFTQFSETGAVSYTVKYKYRGGKFKLVSNIVNIKSRGDKAGDEYDQYFKKNQYFAKKTIKMYKKPGSKKVAFTLREGDMVTLKKIYIGKKGTYLGYKKGSKTGWIKGTWGTVIFYGVDNRLFG